MLERSKINHDEVLYDNFCKGVKISLNKSATWKIMNRSWGDKTHRICSYTAMFPPALARYFIEKYSSKNDTVLDTFSGRGTTVLEARLLNRRAFAMDLNPLAYVLSRAKAKSFREKKLLRRVSNLEKEFYSYSNKVDITSHKLNSLKTYYSDENLRQIIFLKDKLGINHLSLDYIDNYILAITLGLMHGPMRKNGESIYFSLHMSNHTSMSENYVRKYAKKNCLEKPVDNIFEKISRRITTIFSRSEYSTNNAIVKIGNALEASKHFKIRPKLILTSPPYLNLVNYTQQNWIKMWMLGYENRYDNKNIGIDDKHKENSYEKFICGYLYEISKIFFKKH
ncbi:DNA methyltransferase [Mycoplasma sp. ATU-Cv-508]|uniref:DNA methyltransferase n=1 Tax=Mycoplasma sp. ATU-Cv-508 TaxID=2048001 RepID=UPI0013752E48